MQINVGTPERIVRLVLGAVFLILAIFAGLSSLWTWILGIVGVAMVVTGLLRYCPAWSLLGIKTCRTGK